MEKFRILITGSDQFQEIPKEVKEKLEQVMMKCACILVGNESPFDKSVQAFLKEKEYANVCILETGTIQDGKDFLQHVKEKSFPDKLTWSRDWIPQDPNQTRLETSCRELVRKASAYIVFWNGQHDNMELMIQALKEKGLKGQVLRKRGEVSEELYYTISKDFMKEFPKEVEKPKIPINNFVSKQPLPKQKEASKEEAYGEEEFAGSLF